MPNNRRKPMEVVNNDTPTLADHYPFRHPLDTGDKGFLVLWVQSRLATLGFYKGDLDGRYDREMSLSVRAFQASANLKVTGVVDRKTWDAL
jgi:peptidoglycan hydrolase-like protein with peptidoglycan-binding domain